MCFNRELWSIQAYKTVKTSNILGAVSVPLTPWLMSFSDGFPLLYCAVDGLWTPIIFGLKFGFCTTCTYFASWPRKTKKLQSPLYDVTQALRQEVGRGCYQEDKAEASVPPTPKTTNEIRRSNNQIESPLREQPLRGNAQN